MRRPGWTTWRWWTREATGPFLLMILIFTGTAVLAIAARVGTTRLIDNVIVHFGTERHAADD